jgi:hypothetical protein
MDEIRNSVVIFVWIEAEHVQEFLKCTCLFSVNHVCQLCFTSARANSGIPIPFVGIVTAAYHQNFIIIVLLNMLIILSSPPLTKGSPHPFK